MESRVVTLVAVFCSHTTRQRGWRGRAAALAEPPGDPPHPSRRRGADRDRNGEILSYELLERVPNAVQVTRPGPGERPPIDDLDLVERLRRHDADAYRLLYARHARYLAGVVYRLLGGDHELEDVVQECFVDAVEGIGH